MDFALKLILMGILEVKISRIAAFNSRLVEFWSTKPLDEGIWCLA